MYIYINEYIYIYMPKGHMCKYKNTHRAIYIYIYVCFHVNIYTRAYVYIHTRVCEPLKMYSRNKGGTEYKSFSPFTLFADACVVDAEDAVRFKKVVTLFTKNIQKSNSTAILAYLEMWSANHNHFIKISNNQKVKSLEPLSQILSEVSKLLAVVIKTEKITKEEYNTIKQHIKVLREPYMDTELAIVEPLNNLITYCKENYLMP